MEKKADNGGGKSTNYRNLWSCVKGQSALWYQVNECVFVVCCLVLRVDTDTLIYIEVNVRRPLTIHLLVTHIGRQ